MEFAEIINERRPEEGVVFGGQPTEEQLRALAKAGLKTVIDLRGAGEPRGFDEAAVAAELGLAYVSIPLTQQTVGGPEPFDDFAAAFPGAERSVLVHCASGDRVGGAYFAYLATAAGVAPDTALEKAREAGLRSPALEALVGRYLEIRGAGPG